MQIEQSFNAKIEQSSKTINAKFEHKNNESITKSINSIKLLINKIDADIVTTTTKLSTEIALDNIRNLCTDNNYNQKFLETYLANGRIEFTETALELILVNIKLHCDWHYPALQVNPDSKKWIDCMVTADPLYLINHTNVLVNKEILYIQDELVDDIIINYSVEYQQRLRVYDMQDQNFSALPQEQFGIIVCNFLNLFKLEIIKLYLSTFFKLSRPGGKLICTLRTMHPCILDTLVEQDYFKYAANLVIQELFKNAGYEINSIRNLISEEINYECVFLIDARKPGTLTTTKMHQVLGEIIEK